MNSKKRIIITISILILLLVLGFAIWWYLYEEKIEISLKKDLQVPYKSTVTNLSFIDYIKNGTIITKEKNIDTTKLGKKKITISFKNKYGRKEKKSFEITVIDITPPEIEYQEILTTVEGNEIDLLKDVTAIDDVDQEIEILVEGTYDFQKADTYPLSYVAKDQSGNEMRKEFTLIVEKKPAVQSKSNNQKPDSTFTTSKGFSGYTKNGVTYIDGILIANKTYSLPSNYGNGLTQDTINAFDEMKKGARNAGLNIEIISGFRSYDKQNTIYNNYVAKDGKVAADRYSARPGHSEHQTGMAVDINSLYTSFENTNEGKWLSANSYQYGFILRYPKDGEDITGYMYEPWHFRYVGKDLATKLYNNGAWITLEEYFGITSQYE